MDSNLLPQHRNRLMGIVATIEDNGEDSSLIQEYVDQYKAKYSGIPDTLKVEEFEGFNELSLPEGTTLGGFVRGVGKMIDYVGAAPVRNAIYQAIEAKDENKSPDWAALKGFLDQYTKSPESAPTGKDIALKLGVSQQPFPKEFTGGLQTKINPAGVIGFLTDIGADWTNVIPGRTLGKLAIRSSKDPLKQTAKAALKTADIATTTKVPSIIGEGVSETVGAFKGSLKEQFGAQPVKTWESSKEIAAKLGIPEKDLPAAAKYGKHSLISRFERFEREGPLGRQLMEAYDSGVKKLEKGIEDEVTSFSIPKNMDEAGAQMQGAFDKGLEAFFDDIDVTYDKFLKTRPNLKIKISDFNSMKQELTNAYGSALRESESPIKQIKSQGKEITDLIGGMDFANDNVKYWRGLQKDIGKIAFETKYSLATIPPDVKKLRKIYFLMEKTIQDAIKRTKGGSSVVDELRFNNKKISAMYKDKDSLANFLGKDIAPEKKFSQILGDTRRIKALKTFLEPEDFNKIKASYLENNIIQRGEDGIIKWQGMSSRLRAAERKGILNALFNSGELDSIRDYIRLADRFGEEVLSRSGTGASNQFTFGAYLKSMSGAIGEKGVFTPIRKIITSKKEKTKKIPSLFLSPKDFIKSPVRYGKAAQVFSVQKETLDRNTEKKVIGDYYGVDLSEAPYSLVDNIIKKTKKINEYKQKDIKDRRFLNLMIRDVERQLVNYRKQKEQGNKRLKRIERDVDRLLKPYGGK